MQKTAKQDLNKLYAQAKSGDQRACYMLYDICKRLVQVKIKDAAKSFEIEDFLQKLFMRILISDNFDQKKSSFTSWFLMLARSEFIDQYRKNKRVTKHLKIVYDRKKYEKSDKNIFKSCVFERSDFVQKCVKELEIRSAEVIVLQFIYGRTQVEVSRILSMPLGTVKSKSYRALKLLRKIMENSYEETRC